VQSTAAGQRRPGSGSSDGPAVRFAAGIRSVGVFGGLLVAAAVVAAVVGESITATPPVPGLPQPSTAVAFGIPAVRTLLDVAAVATAGLALLARFVGFDQPEAAEPVLARARRLAAWTAGTWAAAALVAVVLLTAELEPGRWPTPASVWDYVGHVPAGKGLLLSAGCGLLSLWLARLSLRHGERVPAELRAGVALFGLLPLPLTGHATNWTYHDLSMVSMELHVVGASAWAGGLFAVVVFLAGRPGLLAAALPRFSRLATWCVVVVGLTGVFNGLLELAVSPVTQLPGSLLTTGYGVLVTVKAVLLVGVAAIAIVVRTRFLPHIANRQRTAIALWCGFELLLLAVAFGVAVVLTRASITPL
jgi:putative copper resistance protein D